MQILEDLCLITLILEEKYPTDKLVRHVLERINAGLPGLQALLTARPVVADIVAPAPVAVAAVEPKSAVELDPFTASVQAFLPFTASVQAFLDDGWEDDPEPVKFRWLAVRDMLKAYDQWSGVPGSKITTQRTSAFNRALEELGCKCDKSGSLKVAKRRIAPPTAPLPFSCFVRNYPTWQQKPEYGWWHGLSTKEVVALDLAPRVLVFGESTTLPSEAHEPKDHKRYWNDLAGDKSCVLLCEWPCVAREEAERHFIDRRSMWRIVVPSDRFNRACESVRDLLAEGKSPSQIADLFAAYKTVKVYRPGEV